MQTYNFEQAMEALAHGVSVSRSQWVNRSHVYLVNDDGRVMWAEFFDLYVFDLNDFYAQDWVAYEGD